MNKITKQERERILRKARSMVELGMTFDQVVDALRSQTGISSDRARRAVGKAIRVNRYERVKKAPKL